MNKAAALAAYEELMATKDALWVELHAARKRKNEIDNALATLAKTMGREPLDARCKELVGIIEAMKPALGEAWMAYKNAEG
jgi:hypothetical protein